MFFVTSRKAIEMSTKPLKRVREKERGDVVRNVLNVFKIVIRVGKLHTKKLDVFI